MDLHAVLLELEAMGNERTRKTYMRQGAREPLFGVATGAMKPLAKKIMHDQALAEQLYATGNYDAMYLAGMAADPKAMSGADFDRWMEGAYFFMASDYIVAVTLAETDIAQEVSDRWIGTGRELYLSAGYSCYCWLLGSRKDEEFDREKLSRMLDTVQKTIHESPGRARHAMSNFVSTVGVSYVPLHGKALSVADAGIPDAAEVIRTAAEKGRLGFKRRNVRC